MTSAESERLDRVLAIEDVGVRNVAITRAYYRMARLIDGVLGAQDANWLTFGTWASASAGRFIRQEELPVRWGSDAVAAGNAAIIADIGPRFAAFIALAEEVPTQHLADAVEGEPALTDSAELAEAFSCYAEAAGLRSALARDGEHAELVLRANTLVAHHEQRLADEYIDAALPLGGPFGMVATRFVTFEVPDGEQHVDRDVVPPQYLDGAPWPAALMSLRDQRLVELARRYGLDDSSARHSGARSWEDFYERMGFIFCFFRAYQRDPLLRGMPPGVPTAQEP